MGENDPLAKQNMIPLGHNRTNGAVYAKIKLQSRDVLCTLHFRCSLVIPLLNSLFPALILLNLNNHYNHVFITFLTITTLFIVIIYCAQ